MNQKPACSEIILGGTKGSAGTCGPEKERKIWSDKKRSAMFSGIVREILRIREHKKKLKEDREQAIQITR